MCHNLPFLVLCWTSRNTKIYNITTLNAIKDRELWSLSKFVVVVVLVIVVWLHLDTEATPVCADSHILLKVGQSVVQAVLDVQVRGVSNNRESEG